MRIRQNFCRFSKWRWRLAIPASSALRFSVLRSSFFTPPCILRARMVATITTASGANPVLRRLIGNSAAQIGPEAAFRHDIVGELSPVVVARTELQPCAMLANGPPSMNAGVPCGVSPIRC